MSQGQAGKCLEWRSGERGKFRACRTRPGAAARASRRRLFAQSLGGRSLGEGHYTIYTLSEEVKKLGPSAARARSTNALTHVRTSLFLLSSRVCLDAAV